MNADFLILAGGEARRLDGADKPMVEVAGLTLLDRVITACLAAPLAGAAVSSEPEYASASCVPSTTSVTVVGPPRPTRVRVRWVRENPPGGGPVAAIAAGLETCAADLVGIFAADLPFLDAETVHRLWTTLCADDTYDGAVAIDAEGRDQWLAAVYRHDALASKIAEFGPDGARGLPLRRVARALRLLRVDVSGASLLDCDTWEDVAAARRLAARSPSDVEGG